MDVQGLQRCDGRCTSSYFENAILVRKAGMALLLLLVLLDMMENTRIF